MALGIDNTVYLEGDTKHHNGASHLVHSCADMCATYSLASSFVEYVTFTTAVSVSVFTARMTEGKRETGDTVNRGVQVHGRSLLLLQVRRVQVSVVIHRG